MHGAFVPPLHLVESGTTDTTLKHALDDQRLIVEIFKGQNILIL